MRKAKRTAWRSLAAAEEPGLCGMKGEMPEPDRQWRCQRDGEAMWDGKNSFCAWRTSVAELGELLHCVWWSIDWRWWDDVVCAGQK